MNGDSIWNGADDNATVSVALLAAARAFAKHPAPRPILFVWHGAEERGLLGSRWYVGHPTVPHSQIIAVLNADMIGRNNPDSAALLGVQPPHRNSNALVDAALRANAELTQFKLDTIWDRPTHPEGWYFRSDHLPYARAGHSGDRVQHAAASRLSHAARRAVAHRHPEADEDGAVDVRDGLDRRDGAAAAGRDSGVQARAVNRRTLRRRRRVTRFEVLRSDSGPPVGDPSAN